ncbi:leucyl aminopeptidase [Thermithiobacillus plumbiphilus]|uniref:Probable cytosol aminopeptidase n=1 Tax=Thermithiobacillus plumbiphilus TaxID=1729899 RepID=A0ABU9D5X2_9PROT
MEFTIKSGSPEKQRTACLVIGVFESRRLSQPGTEIDRYTDHALSAILRRGDIEGRLGQTLLLHNLPNILADRVLLVGCGKERDFRDSNYRKVIATAVQTLNDTGSMEAVLYLPELNVRGRELDWKVQHAVEAAQFCLYRFDKYKTGREEDRRPLRKITLAVPRRSDLRNSELAVTRAEAIARGINFARDLANEPPNVCTPSFLADKARELAESHALKATVLDREQMQELGMNLLLGVSAGSRQPPKLITLEYQGAGPDEKPVVLVGKGVTFDSGGISIKPAANMDEMKYDMAGAASVLATIQVAAELKLPLNVVAVVPASENLPDGNANKPGDIQTGMAGKTVEILNTDAEGRLLLADALTYAARFNPDVVIDVATLTGACVVALGKHAAGLMGNNDRLIKDLLDAGQESCDRAWHLPLWDDYQEQIRSPFADLANVGGRDAGAITAGCFLSRFTEDYKWAHLDIAGVAWKGGEHKGATGRPVPLLSTFLIERARPDKD